MRITILTFPFLIAMPFSCMAAYKCTIDGDVVFSQTPCASDAKDVHLWNGNSDSNVNKKSSSQSNGPTEAERVEYEKKKEAINQELRSLNLGLDQTPSELLKNKGRRRQLERELKSLERDWAIRNGQGNAAQWEQEDKIEALQKKVNQLEQGRGSYTVTNPDGSVRHCNDNGNNVYCY